jgi:arginase
VLTGPSFDAQRAAVAVEEPVLTIGSDCGVELAPIARARRVFGEDMAVLWLDAHPDLNTPESSPSVAFHAMVLRALLGEGDRDLRADPPLSPGNVMLVGARSFDPAEQAVLSAGVGRLVGDDVPVALVGAEHVYVHLDLDVLDPTAFRGVHYPEPAGLTLTQLLDVLDALEDHHVVGAGITECAGNRDDVQVLGPVIDRIATMLR